MHDFEVRRRMANLSLTSSHPGQTFWPGRGHASPGRSARATVAASNGRSRLDPDENVVQSIPSEEKFLDLSEVLRDCPDDFMFKDDGDEAQRGPDWDYESRFQREPPSGDSPAVQVKGALDPEQADILSAYSTEQGFREDDVSGLKQATSGNPETRVLDVRTPEEYADGHVPTAVNVELSKLSADALSSAGFNPQDRVYVICASGRRSAQACVRMNKVFGFKDVINVKGGTLAWIGAGEDVERA